MSYHKLPTIKKQAFITALSLVIYGVFFYYSKMAFPDISNETKMFLSQYGLLVIFVSALLASIGLLWSAKVNHNKELAESEIKTSSINIEVLKEQQKQLGSDFSKQIEFNEVVFDNAKRQLGVVEKHPKFVAFSGRFSILVLAIGTLMCVVGAG